MIESNLNQPTTTATHTHSDPPHYPNTPPLTPLHLPKETKTRLVSSIPLSLTPSLLSLIHSLPPSLTHSPTPSLPHSTKTSTRTYISRYSNHSIAHSLTHSHTSIHSPGCRSLPSPPLLPPPLPAPSAPNSRLEMDGRVRTVLDVSLSSPPLAFAFPHLSIPLRYSVSFDRQVNLGIQSARTGGGDGGGGDGGLVAVEGLGWSCVGRGGWVIYV